MPREHYPGIPRDQSHASPGFVVIPIPLFFWFPWCINLKSNLCSHQLTSESELVVRHFAMQIMNSKGGVCACFSDFSGHPGINALNFADRYVSGSERTELPSIGRALANDDR